MIVAANIICIYIMINNITGQIYIGQTGNFDKRIDDHFKGKNAKTQWIDRACLKYGKEAFTYKPLEVFDEYDKDVLNDAEEFYVAAYNTFRDKNHYNLTPGGDGFGAGEDHPMWRDDLDDDVLRDEYVNQGLSCSEIARRHNTNPATVIYRLNNLGIDTSRDALKNTTGFYRVSQKKAPSYKQGFCYTYNYIDNNGKKKSISAVDLKKLEAKVKEKGLPWYKL